MHVFSSKSSFLFAFFFTESNKLMCICKSDKNRLFYFMFCQTECQFVNFLHFVVKFSLYFSQKQNKYRPQNVPVFLKTKVLENYFAFFEDFGGGSLKKKKQLRIFFLFLLFCKFLLFLLLLFDLNFASCNSSNLINIKNEIPSCSTTTNSINNNLWLQCTNETKFENLYSDQSCYLIIQNSCIENCNFNFESDKTSHYLKFINTTFISTQW
jgi:hypothetical protein